MLAETISSVKQRKNNITPLSRRNKATSAPDSRLSRFLNSLQRWSDNFMSPNSCFIVTPCRHRTWAVWHNSIAHIIISEAVYTGCHAMTRLILDSKLLPRSISDILTLISNDFQQSACSCCVQCRHGVSLILFCRHFSLFFFYPPSLSFCPCSANVRHVHWWALSPRIMSRHAPYCWLATSLFLYWPDSVF